MAEVPNLKNYIRRVSGGGSTTPPELPDSGWIPVIAGTGTGGYTVGSADMLGADWQIPSSKDSFGIWQRALGGVVWTRFMAIIAAVDDPKHMISSSDLHFPPSGDEAFTVLASLTRFGAEAVDTYAQLLMSGGITTGNASNIEQSDQLGGFSRLSLISYPLDSVGGGL